MKLRFLIALIVLLAPFVSAQWDDCPRDQIYCEGACGSFIDTNADGYCDHSQPEPILAAQETPADTTTIGTTDVNELITGQELKTMTVSEVAQTYSIDENLFAEKLTEYLNIKVKTTDSFQFLHDNYGAEPSIVKDIAYSISIGETPEVQAEKTEQKKPYVFWPVIIILVSIYVVSYILAKKDVITLALHKRIWNMLLFISFFIAAVLGMLLAIRINFGWTIQLPFNMLFWHVEAGIVLFLIACFHIMWHWYYFKAMFQKPKK